jgi:membrane associated rhomboid family serine protease
MIPLKDILPSKSRPVVVISLIALNAGMWAIELMQGARLDGFLVDWGLVPARLLAEGDPVKWLTPLSSMFMHGGWLHIISNMWFLWIFGDNVEDAFGHAGFAAFYLACGLGAALMQFLITMGSTVPMVGASGAISGILGAYACFFPRARIVTLLPIFIFIQFVEVPALIFVVLWFMLQLLSGCATLGMGSAGGVAFWAHIGGFIVGWLVAYAWKRRLMRLGREIYPSRDALFTFRTRRGYSRDE